jgi:transposase
MPRTHSPISWSTGGESSSWRRGRKIDHLAREFELSTNAVGKWIKQAAPDEGLRSDGLATNEREELNRLRRKSVRRRAL